jgi:hypothetical protein
MSELRRSCVLLRVSSGSEGHGFGGGEKPQRVRALAAEPLRPDANSAGIVVARASLAYRISTYYRAGEVPASGPSQCSVEWA